MTSLIAATIATTIRPPRHAADARSGLGGYLLRSALTLCGLLGLFWLAGV